MIQPWIPAIVFYHKRYNNVVSEKYSTNAGHTPDPPAIEVRPIFSNRAIDHDIEDSKLFAQFIEKIQTTQPLTIEDQQRHGKNR